MTLFGSNGQLHSDIALQNRLQMYTNLVGNGTDCACNIDREREIQRRKSKTIRIFDNPRIHCIAHRTRAIFPPCITHTRTCNVCIPIIISLPIPLLLHTQSHISTCTTWYVYRAMRIVRVVKNIYVHALHTCETKRSVTRSHACISQTKPKK